MLFTFWRFRGILRRYRFPLSVGSALVVVVAATDVAAPWPLKVIVDNVLRHRPLSGTVGSMFGSLGTMSANGLLTAAVLALLVIIGLNAVADYLGSYLLDAVGERVTADLRGATFAHLQRQSLHFHDRQRVGDLVTRLTGDVNYVQDMLVASLSVLLPNLTVLVGIVGVMFLIDSGFALLSLAVAPLLFMSVFVYTRRIKRASKLARRKESEVASVASEALTSIRVVQAYASEPRHFSRFADRNRERLAAGLRVAGLQSALTPLVDVITAVGTALVLWVGAHRVMSGRMTLGVLLVFLAYLSQLYKPMRNLSKLAWIVSRGQASSERLHELLATDVRVIERPDAVAVPRLSGGVELIDVSFGYAPGRPVLDHVSIEAARGETIALAGPTGAGKSTLVSLIPRLYDPWEGRVLVDGRDIRGLTLACLRRQVALVLQDSILFHGTIYENIAYGAERPTEKQVLGAAEAAYVDEFVRALPEGYQTVVAERGTTLSGGQRQRIAIARAIVRDAPIVILDEPTSGLDAVSERYVLKGLQRLTAGRTVFVVAHRLSTLRDADRIYVLQRGRIVDCGTHSELAGRTGLYRRMVVALAGGTEPVRRGASERGFGTRLRARLSNASPADARRAMSAPVPMHEAEGSLDHEQEIDAEPISPELVLISPELWHTRAR